MAELGQLKNQRASTKASITRVKNLMDLRASTLTDAELECRLAIVEAYFKQFLSYQAEIERLDPTNDEQLEQRNVIEDLYCSVKSKIITVLRERREQNGGNVNQSSFFQSSASVSHLPKLKMPQFSGKYTDFPMFIKTFETLMSKDPSLTVMEKYNHLLSCLSGAALRTIKSIDVTELNYEKALTVLKNRYDNKTLIFQEHIRDLFSLDTVAKNSAVQLRYLLDTVNAHLTALLSLGTYEEITNSFLIHIVCARLDSDALSKWEESINYAESLKWKNCADVLTRRCQYLETRDVKTGNTFQGKHVKPKSTTRVSEFGSLVSTEVKCIFCCGSDHKIYKCPKFSDLSVMNRYNETKKLSLCLNCLSRGHSIKKCTSSKCRVCGSPHHTLLHRYVEQNQSNSTNNNNDMSLEYKQNQQGVNSSNTLVVTNATLSDSSKSVDKDYKNHTFLATAVIMIRDDCGVYHKARALLDSASQLNFISKELSHQLKLKRKRLLSSVSGISSVSAKIKYQISTTIRSRFNNYESVLSFWVLPHITELQPQNKFDTSSWNIPNNINLADPIFNQPQRVDVLIGADIFFDLLCVGQIRLGCDLPILQKTLLGWIISGKYTIKNDCYATFCSIISEKLNQDIEDNSLQNLVEKFWQTEDIVPQAPIWSEEQSKCENHFLQHIKQLPCGRLMVKLPFKCSPTALGDSINNARYRLHQMEKRLNNRPDINTQYSEFLSQYLEQDHMEIASWDSISKSNYFMPHQFVLRPESSTTKLRVVFDASSKTTTQLSLNDVLMVGPTVQNDLLSIILRFRCHKIGLTADIASMYRQICVYPEDTNYQCILWRSSSDQQVKLFKLKTVTYGTAAAPFLATRCLKYLADRYSDKYPITAQVVANDFYVDDLITGGENEQEILNLKQEVELILGSAHFHLRKWHSNDKNILAQIPEAEREKSLRINDSDVIKTLGIIWNPETDEFTFNYDSMYENSTKVTKRTILSDTSRLYDPLGLISPVILRAKILLQELWLQNIGWDESVTLNVQQQWMEFKRQLQYLKHIKLPRFILSRNANYNLEIHGFSDASLRAFGCCIYVRCTGPDQDVVVNLYIAKSKVAPTKITRSLPCLELCGFDLLAKTLDKIRKNIKHHIDKIYLWTDSVIVLDWLASHPSTWKVFVANRVSSIQQLVSDASCRYVPSKLNPADVVSRGSNVQDIIDSRWYVGPEFLYKPVEQWPSRPARNRQRDQNELPERRSNQKTFVCIDEDSFVNEIYRTSSFTKICRRFAYILRFCNNLQLQKLDGKRLTGPLSASEIDSAFIAIISVVQKTEFAEDIVRLRKNKYSSSSAFKLLNAFIDDSGKYNLLRVGGRIDRSHLPYDAKFPILLPKSNHFVEAYVRYLHFQNFHAGAQTLMAILRQRFWIVGARDYARKIVRGCLHCFRYRPRLHQQIMGALPKDRVIAVKPFVHAGVDFCGPIQTTYRLRGKALYKSYIAIFVCFCTKAVHLEVVSDLTADAFIAALKRFISRRGLCSKLYCDNATNFVGARRQLAELRKAFLSQEYNSKLLRWCADNAIEFHHIPPRSPHFGGIWESAVKMAKGHFYRTFQSAVLTFEELSTVAAQIESILNSRPITQLSSDPNDEEVLTPAHFLNQRNLDCIAEPDISIENCSHIRKWRQITALQQHFWRRWSKEYLVLLQQRNKWNKESPDLKIGSMVLVHEDNLPPQKWLLGRIIATIRGSDSHVRVVDVKTKCGVFRRAITKIAPIPIEEN